ncbi:MAG: bifunctional diguanylate cyclase/phosphodiesterase [Actinobacteria bacterium]|nr:bifunctional diguanylate cyclase/phosphodiesterase [Actinomycetota bacterium]
MPATLLLLDLEDFSKINQAFGPDGGDALLAETANRLRRDLADCDLVARLGEDEFGVLFAGADPEAIAAVGARIQQSLAPSFLVDGVRVSVGASMGAAVLEETDFPTLLRRATAALAAASKDGLSDVRAYEHSLDSDDFRIARVAELRDTLDSGQLLVHYQPQADLSTRQVRGVEALVRWQHPARGLVAAGEFIEVAERSGVAKDIRRFVLEAAVQQWREWKELGIDLEIAVNLSTVDLLDDCFPAEIAGLLERYSMPAWNLVFEITERTLGGHDRRMRDVTERLNRIGIRLAIDDFGVGYSSLASLRRYRIHLLKVDASLLAGVPGDPAAAAIVKSSVEMAHAIGVTVVAEGIETRAQWSFINSLGCDIAQGYFIGRPVPAAEISERLSSVPRVTTALAA